ANLIASGRLSPSEATDSVRIIKEQVKRTTLIIQQLLAFARRKSPRRVAVDLRPLVQHTLDMLPSLAAQQHALLTLTAHTAPIPVRVDTGQIEEVLMNRVTNAWHAMPAGGEVAIAVSSTTAQPPPGLASPAQCYACVSVPDQGVGIPPQTCSISSTPF